MKNSKIEIGNRVYEVMIAKTCIYFRATDKIACTALFRYALDEIGYEMAVTKMLQTIANKFDKKIRVTAELLDKK